jgi:hypothetical protein
MLNKIVVLLSVSVVLLAFGLLFRPQVRPSAVPVVWPYDVTFYMPGEGAKTIVVHSSNLIFKDSCVISTAPKYIIVCQLLVVVPCTESCKDPIQTEEPTPDPVPSALDHSNLIARR